jgi:hypothetical protein
MVEIVDRRTHRIGSIMSIRIQGRKLASNLTTTVSILSLGAAGIATLVLWDATEQAKADSAAGITGSTSQVPQDSQLGDDSGQQSAGASGQQGVPVGPSQNFAPQAQSSGS